MFGLFGSSGSLVSQSVSSDPVSPASRSSQEASPSEGGRKKIFRFRSEKSLLSSVELLQRALRKSSNNDAANLKAVLEAMFNLDDLVPERTQSKLYDFLLQERNLARMVMLLTSDKIDLDNCGVAMTAREMHCHRYVVCVFFLYGPPTAREYIVASEALMMPLIDFVTTQRPVSVVGVEYVARVLASLMHCAPLLTCKRMRSRENFVAGLVKRISSGAVSQLIQRMICERAYFDDEVLHFGPMNAEAIRLLSESGLQDLLADVFITEASLGVTVNDTVKVIGGTIDCMVQVSLRATASVRYIVGPDDSSRASAKELLARQLGELDLLRNSSPLVRCIDASLSCDGWTLVTCLVGVTTLVNSLVTARKSRIPEIRRVAWDASMSPLFVKMLPLTDRLLERLEVDSAALGAERLEICRVIASMFTLGSDEIALELTRRGAHTRIFQLTFQMKNCSMLHSVTVQLVKHSLTSDRTVLEDMCLNGGNLAKELQSAWEENQGPSGSEAMKSVIRTLAQIMKDFVDDNPQHAIPRDLSALMGKENVTRLVQFSSEILGKECPEESHWGKVHRSNTIDKDAEFVYDEDEPEALFLYNRLLEREIGEDTEEGTARSGKAKKKR